MNCLYITLFFNIVADIVQTFIKPWNQLLYPRVIEVCRQHFESRHDFFHLIIVVEIFSQRDVSLGEEISGNRWARGPDCTADGPIYPTWNPTISFCDRPLTFWAPSVSTILCTLIFLSQLHELWS